MLIIHEINDFLFDLFPKAKASGKNLDVLMSELREYYSYGPYQPAITIKDNLIEISIESNLIERHNSQYQDVVELCEKGKYEQAKGQLNRLIKEAPHVSEYHRIFGQILSDQGDQDGAINCLIDALRWDPDNKWALIMTGNILARHQQDITAATKYYQRAIRNNPEDNIALNNIGATLMELGKNEEALGYFKKAIELNPDYPNTYYALALLEENEKHMLGAFENAIKALKKNPRKDALYHNSLQTAVTSAKALIGDDTGDAIVHAYAAKLELEGGKSIVVQKDSTIPTSAKFEFAENYDRAHHIVKYKPDYPAVQHLIMHELVHLELVLQARLAGKNKVYITKDSQKKSFIIALEKDAKKLNKKGYGAEVIARLFTQLYDGINRQIFNTPVDLVIEDYLYKEYHELRPYQFLSILTMTREGLHATTEPKIVALMPPMVLSKSKSYNLLSALHLRSLFGVNLIDEHKPTNLELKLAKTQYDEYEELQKERGPGDEYQLVQCWAEDLYLQNYFSLIDESEFRSKDEKEKEFDVLLNSATDLNEQTSINNAFTAAHKDKELNMAVVMFMVDAIRFFKKCDETEIRSIAIEIAMLGTKGIKPETQDYRLQSIAEKVFTGYHLLAYYYVSWALIFPEMLDKLSIPFDKEYDTAKQLSSMMHE